MKLGKLGSSISSLLLAAPLGLAALQAHAYPYPPAWNGPTWDAGEVIEGTSPTTQNDDHGGAIHFAPAPWPAEPDNPAECGVQCGDWKPYSRFQTGVNDPRVQDPSNGGTSPQNYVNIASSCVDKNLPSIYYHLRKGLAADGSDDVIMFRWRVEQIANTYATGPSPGNFSTTDPWNSALWTVLFDLDGDGFRDLSAHLDGSSGSPSTAIDRVAGIWGNIPTQSVDYQNDPSIKLIAHNPTAFIGGTNKILNFLGDPEDPTESWPNGSAERTWDYGTTRSKLVYTNSCTEYFIDYQIPARMLDASSGGPNPSLNGPKITRDTPISMLFCTANSLNNPFQKDCALNASYVGDVAKPAPFGDYLSFNKETPYAQPIVTSVTATAPSTCPGNYSLTAKIQDTLYVNQSGSVEPSIQSVKFYYWFDRNGDGKTTGDTGSVWTYAVDGVLKPGTLNTWTASWNANTLLKGRYLVGVQALDDGTKHDNDVPDVPVDHRTFSYLPGSDDLATQAQIYTNDWSWDGLAKIWVPGSDIGWIEGQEPPVFPGHYPAIAPGPTEDWYGNPDVTGVQTALIGVALNVCGVSPELVKSANVTETTAGGDVQYTLQVVNKTAGTLSLNSITDTLPDGFSYVSTQGPSDSPASSLCTSSCPDPTTGGGNSYTWVFSPTAATVPGGCSSLDYSDCTRTLVYNTMASATVGTYNNVASMLTDFGSVASNPVQVGVGEPRLTISKTPTDGATPPNPKYSAAQGDSITYLVTYANDSPVIATGVTLIDVIPEGLTYGSCTGGCTHSGGTLTWNIGDLIPGEGPYSVSYTATIANPYPDTAAVPNVNTATIDGDNTTPADATASVFVQVPRPKLVIQKTADKTLVDPAGTSPADQVTYTLSYRNAGDATATNAVITDVVPAGFSFVSATNQIGTNCTTTPAICSYNTTTRVVTWNLANLASEASGSVTLTLQVSNPYTGTANPAANTATLDADNAAPVEDDAYVGVRESAEVCSDFYFRADTGDVGSAGTQKLATTLPVPVAGDTGGSTLLTAPAGSTGTWSPALSFYQDPASSKIVGLSGNLSTRMYINRTPGAGIIVRTTVYDYNSATGGRTQLGQGETTFNGSSTGLLTFSVPFAAGAVLAKDHRMLWTYEIKSSVNNSTADILFQYDGTVANTQTDGSTSTFADSSARFCVLPPANLALDKRVDQSYVSATGAGRTLTYTIDYANTGATAASVAKITDTLPSAGILSATCAITGSTHFTGCTVSGSQVTFHNGSGGGVSIPAGASGSVTITATLADNLTITELTNTATISSNETSDLSAAATTLVGRDDPQGSADLVISKAASATLLQPGDSVTYTLTALNAGTKTATNIVVSDNFPEAAWFTYEGTCTATVGTCTPAGTPTGSLSWAIDSLAPGATATLSFTLKVGTAATTLPPDGVTTRDNLATGNYQGCATAPCSATSNTVTVSVTTNPYLAIEKSVSPSGVVAPGGILTYTLLVSNTGSGSANDVLVRDPIPANTSFIAGSTTQSQGSASFDAVNNQVIFDVGSIDGDGSATLTFKVKLNSPLPAGDSTLTNLATVSASNALSRTDNAVSTAQAKPVLTLEKSGPASAPYPAARLTAAANGSTTLFVNATSAFEVGQYIRVGSTLARITELAGTAMIVDPAITAAANTDVIGAVTYSLTYRNTGDADATGVVIIDTLPAGPPGLTYVASSPNASSAPAFDSSGVVVWNLGTLPAGASGAVQVIALPTGAGTVTNLAAIDSTQTDPVEDSAETAFGGLRVTKRTTTPITTAPGEATYVIEVTNSLATPVAGVTLTDTLTSGFTYKSAGTIVATGATRTGTSDPTVGTQQPTWGTWTLPANGSLTLTFTADVGDPSLGADDQPVGPGTYQNEASVATTTPGIGITPFDPLATTAEDVTILPPGSGVVQGIVYEDNDKDGSFDPLKDTPLGGVSVTIVASDGTVYVAITDSAGLYRQVVPAGDTVVDVQNGTVPPKLVPTTGVDGTDPYTVTVPSGGSASKNVGYVPASSGLASIRGNVWNDADDNRVVNGTESGMIGVQVILRDKDGNAVATEYTDELGNYAFPNIPPGDYRVDVVPPTGYLVTTGNDPDPVSVAAGVTGKANFGLLQGAILSGTVFNDLDASGLQNGGETGLDPGNLNVVVLDASGKVLAVVPVGNDGTWTALVKKGSGYQAYYTLQNPTLGDTVTPLAQLPAGWLVTGENISGTVQAPANGILTGIDASADRSGLNYGIRSGGSIGDYVWYDTNHDGIQDPAEPGIAGVKVILYAADGTTKLAETWSDGSGHYQFAGLGDGTYVVHFIPGVDYLPSPVNAGSGVLQDSFDSDASLADSRVAITLTGGTANPTVDAGFYIQDANPAGIADFVWYDTNEDGIQDVGEPGLGGITVSLLDADNSNALVSTRISDANGFYEFAGLRPGNYVLQFSAPSGYSLSPQNSGGDDTKDSDADEGTGLTPTIALTAGERLSDVDQGLNLTTGSPASIGNLVWYDSDGDGIQAETGEPGIPGVRVNLYDATGTTLLQTALTDPAGAYRFNGLSAGSYVVEVVKPNSSYAFSAATQGGDTTKDSDPDPTTGRVAVPLTAGLDNNDIDAGLRVTGKLPLTIGDFVWKDLDGQKDPDNGEGLANVQVVLYDNLGFPLARLTTTSADANYGFTGVAAGGNYRVAIDTGTLGNLIQIADPDATFDNRTDLINQAELTTAADFGYLAPDPKVTIVKSASNDGDTQQIRNPGVATFKITVKNTGNLTLNNVMIIDAIAGDCERQPGTLAPGAELTYTCQKDTSAGSTENPDVDFTNTATVEGQPVDPSGNPVGDKLVESDTSVVVVIDPAINITKTLTNGPVTRGGVATFSIIVTNTGDVDLTDVAVSDTSAPDCDRDKASANDPITNSNLSRLEPAETYSYECTVGVTDSFTNTVEVTGTPPVGADVTDTDSAEVPVTTPGLKITKVARTPYIKKGDSVTFDIEVENTGSATLTNLTVTDALASTCDISYESESKLQSLAVGARFSYDCTVTEIESSFTNTVVADSVETGEATDVADVTVIDLTINKVANDDYPAPNPTLHTGTLVSFNYMVKNTSIVTLTDVIVSDDQGVLVHCPKTTLAAGESMTCFGYAPAIFGPYTNVGTVSAKAPDLSKLTATDPSGYTGIAPAVIGNYVWLDENGDGVKDAGEPGIPNLMVTLYRPGVGPDGQLGNDDDADPVATTITDALGGYRFSNVNPGTEESPARYTVVVTPTEGLNPTYNEDGGTVAPNNETIVTVTLGKVHLTAYFGYNWVPPADSSTPSATSTGAIGDRVWNDANGDGIQDPGEPGLAGVKMTLTGAGTDGFFGTDDDLTPIVKVTDAAGNFIFDALQAGVYSVAVTTATLPSGPTWTQTADPDGAGSIDGKTTTPILLAPGDVFVNADFGYHPSQGSHIGDIIYYDVEADRAQDVDDPGIAGVTVALLNNNDGKAVATTITDASGHYLFTGLPAGTYTVVVTDTENVLGRFQPSADPDGTIDQRSTLTVDGSTEYLDRDFGYTAFGQHQNFDEDDGTIGDTIFLDRNGNDQFDPGEGLQGVTVSLLASDGITQLATTSTNANGTYSFGRLSINATYIVKVVTTSLPNSGVGLTNSVDPDGGIASQVTVPVLSGTGGINMAQDFGYEASSPATIGGTLWNDTNANGILDAEEAGRLRGITLVLLDVEGNLVATTTTDANGAYSFSGLPAGTYRVHVTDTANELEGWWHSLGNQDPTQDGTSKADPFNLTVAAGQANSNIDFGYYHQGAALGNRVWSDTNGDGIQDSDEPGLAGVSVQLVVTYPGGGTTTLKGVSGADGGYSFGNLLLDESFNGAAQQSPLSALTLGVNGALPKLPTNLVTVVTPEGYTPSPITVGTNRLIDSDDPAGTTATVLKGQLATALLADPADETLNASYDFGFEPLIDLSLTKSVDPVSQKVNELVTFTLTLSNAAGFSDATGVKVTDLLPSGYTFVSADPSADYASASGLWTVGNLAADDSATLTITARVNASGTYENVAEVSAADQTDDDSTPDNSATEPSEDDTASAEPTINSQIDLSLTKTVSTMSPKVGDTVTFTLTLNNAVGYSNATGVSVQDVVPAGYGSISDISDSGSASGNTVTWTGLTVNANTNKSLTFKAVVLPSGPYANSAEVTAADQDDKDSTPNNGTSNEEDDTAGVTPLPDAQIDLSLTKSVAPASPKVGDTVTFTLTLSNAAGYAEATGVSVQDALPAGYGNVSEISDSGSLSGSTLTWSGLSLAAGSSKDLTFKAVVKNTGPYTNVAEITAAAQPDKDSMPNNGATTPAEDDRATLTPTIGEQIDLSLTKTVAPEDPKVGDTVTFTLTAANAAGFTDATGVAVTDLLPSGYAFISADPEADYASATGLWTIGDLDAGASATLKIEARVLASGDYENVAEVTAADQDDKDSTPGNKTNTPAEDEDDTARSKPTVINSADLIVEKNGPVLVDAEGGITYTVTVSNAGPAAADGAVFYDDPASGGLTGDIEWTCGNAVGGAACPTGADADTDGSDGISETIAHFPAGGSLTYTITGTAPDGTNPDDLPVTNTATVTAPAGVSDPDESNNRDEMETRLGAIPATADLSVLKYGPAQVEASSELTSSTLTYRLLVTNAGYVAANDAVFTDDVPEDVTDVTWTCEAVGGAVCPAGVTRAGNTIEETIAVFPAGASLIYTVTGTVPKTIGGIIENIASIAAPEDITDPDESNNTSRVETTVVNPGELTDSADLALVKTGPATVAGGGFVTYHLVVSNAGAAAADGARVSDSAPAVLTDVSWYCDSTKARGGAECPVGSTNVADPMLGDLDTVLAVFPADSSLTLVLSGTVPAAGAFVNSAQVLPPVGVADPDPTNNLGGPVITQIATVTLAGVVFNDNGVGGGTARNGVQDGGELGVDPGSLNVVVLDGAGKVVAIAPVDVTGAWQAVVPVGTGYTVYVTTDGTLKVGDTVGEPIAALPMGWAATGETSDGLTNDKMPDGILTGVVATESIDTLDFGVEAPPAAVSIIKTLYNGNDGGASCDTADDELVLVDVSPEKPEKDITWCFEITNTGNQYLHFLAPEDGIVDGPLGVKTLRDLSGGGTLPLAPGARAVWYYHERRNESLINSATVRMTPTDALGNPTGDSFVDNFDNAATATFAYIFDPPFGIKTGEILNGQNVVRWNMVWINDSIIKAYDVEITDPISGGMTFRGNLQCSPEGSITQVDSCNFEAPSVTYPRGRLVVVADIGPDPGATDAGTANNELVISFDVTIDNPNVPQRLENQGSATWDPDGPNGPQGTVTGDTDDKNAPGDSDPTPIDFQPPTPIPTLSEWAMILLSLILMGMVWRYRSRFGVNS